MRKKSAPGTKIQRTEISGGTSPVFHVLRLTAVAAVSSLLLCSLLLLLYAAGNIQNFLDSSQIFILKAVFASSSFSAVMSVSGLLASVPCTAIVRPVRRVIIRILILALTGTLSAAAVLFSGILNYLSSGF